MPNYKNLDWWIVSVGPKNHNGDLIAAKREDLIVWDGCRPIFVATRKGTELRDWFMERGVAVSDEIDWAHDPERRSSVFRIYPPLSVGIEARLTFPCRYDG